MVNIRFFTNKIPLEDFHLEGPAVIAGLNKHKAILFSRKVMKNLKKEDIEVIGLYDLIKYSSKFLKNKKIRRNYIILNQYFLASYDREIDEPFFIMIGGASSAGKDILASDLQYLLGIDRVIPADVIREAVRSDILKKHKNIESVPNKLRSVFKALYRTDEKGMELQVKLVKKKLDYFVKEAYRECEATGGFHAFFVFHGTHVMPGFEKIFKNKNSLLVVINPSEKTLKSRILARWEKEYGVMTNKNKKKRLKECDNLLRIKKYIVNQAKKEGSYVINNDNRLSVLHEFGNVLINKLEKILIEKKVKLIKF